MSQSDALRDEIHALGQRARAAARHLAVATTQAKNNALLGMADALLADEKNLLHANSLDLQAGEKRGLAPALLDRLRLDPKRLAAIADGLRQVAALPDPVGEILREWERPNGLRLRKLRTPIGVIAIIYESRPNVTADAAALCLKTGNATILRGGSEAIHSNQAIARCLRAGLETAGLPPDSIQLVQSTDRECVRHLAEMEQFLDVIIPRGGESLIRTVTALARMPVIKHYKGICHIYIHSSADYQMAENILVNGKCQRPGVCNAVETLLLDHAIAPAFLPPLARKLASLGVELRADPQALELLEPLRPELHEKLLPATPADWDEEYLALILAIKIVPDLHAALDHIETHGSRHSDAIITDDPAAAEHFLSALDSATVFWNASTRFNDGGEFGFGAEIGISTDKLHARGPMGLEELTSYKYQIRGAGQIRR